MKSWWKDAIDDMTAPGEENSYGRFLGMLEGMINGDCSRRELREAAAYFDARMEEQIEEQIKGLREEVGA